MHSKGMSQNVAAKLQAVKEKHLAGKIAEAEQGYRELLQRYPALTDILHPLGIALQQQGRHAEAIEFIGRWLKVAPQDYEAMINQGNSLLNVGRAAEASAIYRQASALRPSAPEVFLLKAMADQAAGDVTAAEASVRRSLSLVPGSPEGLFMLGTILCGTGRKESGIQAYRDALRRRPTMVEPMVNLAFELQGTDQRAEAKRLYQEALRLRPGMPEALLNLATIDYEDGADPELTRQQFEQVLAQIPDHPDALNNLANILTNLNQLEEAEHYVRRRLAHPHNPSMAHGTAAALFMLKGQWEEGWQHFEWRWLRDNLPVPLRVFGKPEWRGEDISDKTILIHHEQGLGDSIQFVRFVQEVVKRAGRVILEAPANLIALYGCIPDVTLATYDEPLPPFDVHLAIMSLPYVLGVTVDSVPAPIPYLHPDPARVEAWRERLPQHGFRIGIVWQGKPGTGVDKGRSYTLDQLAPVARVPGVTLISLQKGYGLDQLDRLPAGMQVHTLGPDFDEGPGAFLDTAAVMQHMDLIISSDTSVAHLAGALGRPVWVPLKFSPDWRWMIERDDSPWYPTSMRLFRQTQLGDWPGVFQRLAADVAALIAGDRSRLTPPPPPPRPPLTPFPPVPAPPLPAGMLPVKLLPGQPATAPVTGSVAARGAGTELLRQTAHGPVRYPADDPMVGASLSLYGEWGGDQVTLLSDLVRPGDVVADSAAHVGVLTLALARLVGPTGHVHALEPHPMLHGFLSGNIAATPSMPVTVHPADRAGSLDALTLPSLSLLRADLGVTGLGALKEAQATIARCRPVLYLQVQPSAPLEPLLAHLAGLGYRCWWHVCRLFRPDNFAGTAVNEHGDNSVVNLLALPAEVRPVVIGLPAAVVRS